MILTALTDYNLGYSLEETSARLKKNAQPPRVSSVHDRRTARRV